MTRIAVGGFQHETNSFVDGSTDFAYFLSHRDRPPLVRGADILKWLGPSACSFALPGFLSEYGDEADIVPLVWASGGAGAMVARDAFERISGELVGQLSCELPVDGIYLDLHGAMVTEDFEDGEGELLRRIRAAVGDAIPVVASLDYHANVTQAMVDNADALIAYRTYPHVDRVDTGRRSAQALKRLLKDGPAKGKAFRKLPFLIPLNDQCTLVDPSRSVVDASVHGKPVRCLSYLAGFPASDLKECGPSVVAYADTQKQADEAADELADFISAREAAFAVPVESEDEAVVRAIGLAANARRPIIIADTQDNPGCGGSADTTGLINALLRHNARDAMVGYFCDPDAARAAHEAGLNSEISIALGGKHGPNGVQPLVGQFRVTALGSGSFTTSGPVMGNRNVDVGPTACLAIDGVKIVVTSKRIQAHDEALFRHLNIDPACVGVLVLKSTCHFRAVFEPMAEQVIVASSPGAFCADPATYPYARLRSGVRLRPLGPTFQR